VVVRNTSTPRDVSESSILFSASDAPGSFFDVVTTDPSKLNDADIVVEVAGGTTDAYDIIKNALSESKSVVTANKALLAEKGNELYALAGTNGVDLLFEAAVAGGVPIIRPLRESLAVEHIHSVKAILNGTTNFMLSQMTKNSTGYAEALAEAQSLGYAEADPTADVEGFDAAAKIAIISLLATGANALQSDVKCKGITHVSSSDIATARELGYVIKLIALVEEKSPSEVFLRVEPTFVPISHPFSTVHDGFNAAFVTGERLGEIMLYGRGAGGDPTASAVLGDVIDAAINVANERKGAIVGFQFDKTIADPRDWSSEFYVAVDVADEPGVLAQIAEVFAKHKVSLQTVHQQNEGAAARIVFITHESTDGNISDSLGDLASLACVTSEPVVYPILS
jgi:homoserine dehydrogenase